MSPTPAELIDSALTLKPIVAAVSEQIDRERDIPADIVKQMSDAGFFGMGLATDLGGSASDLVTKFRVIEALSSGNGSAGWVAMIGMGLATAVRGLPLSSARQVFAKGPAVPLAGIGAPLGVGVPVEGGYRVTGKWPFASGCANAEWMVAGVVVQSDQGSAPPIRLAVVLPKHEVSILDTWHVVGLRGTGSRDFEIDDVFVPAAFCLPQPLGEESPFSDPLFRLPTPTVVTVEHVAHAIGMARGALDAFVELCGTKLARGNRAPLLGQGFAQEALARGEAKLAAARSEALRLIRQMWEHAEADDPLPAADRVLYRIGLVGAAHAAGEVIDSVYYAAGADALYDSNPLGRFFRDWHSASQHSILSPSLFAAGGRLLLGLEALPPGW